MSAQAQNYVWQHSKHRGTELVTLLAIADSAHDDGSNACVPIRDLAKKARLSERQTQKVIRKLVKSLELSILQGEGQKHFNVFNVLMRGVTYDRCHLESEGCHARHLSRTTPVAEFTPHAPIEGKDKRVNPVLNQDLGLTQREESIDKNLCYPGARNASVSPPGHPLQSNGLATPALGGKIKPLAEDDWLRTLLLDYEQLDFRYLNDDGWWIDVSQPLGAVFEKEWLNSEFGKISAYLRENPKKKPASSQGWKRFIRSWLHRGYEQQRRMTRGNTQQPTTKRY